MDDVPVTRAELVEILNRRDAPSPVIPPASPSIPALSNKVNWVPIIGLCIGIVAQAVTLVWWVSKLESRVDNNAKVAQANAEAVKDIPDIKKSILLMEKDVTFIVDTVKEVKANTKDRFTRLDYSREIEPLREAILRNSDQLNGRVEFMTETRERLTKLENQRQ
jgi:hypothetical protein